MGKTVFLCALPGIKTDVSRIQVDLNATRMILQREIKAMNPDIQCGASEIQLFLAKRGAGWLPYNDEMALGLIQGEIHQDIRRLIDGEPMNETTTVQEWLHEQNMPARPYPESIHLLVVVPREQYPPTTLPEDVEFRPYPSGLNVAYPHLSRSKLVEKLYEAVHANQFVLMSGPSGSGMTSLLTLFAHRYPEIRCKWIPFVLNKGGHNKKWIRNDQILADHGVDIHRRECDVDVLRRVFRRLGDVDDVPADAQFVFLLDDVQHQYHDLLFWESLIKDSSWLGSTCGLLWQQLICWKK